MCVRLSNEVMDFEYSNPGGLGLLQRLVDLHILQVYSFFYLPSMRCDEEREEYAYDVLAMKEHRGCDRVVRWEKQNKRSI